MTVTTHSAVLPPSSVVTVTVAVPALIALTFPAFGVTVAVASSDVVNAIVLLVASSGVTVALSVAVSPTLSVKVV